jgi:ubiquitin-like protein Pup
MANTESGGQQKATRRTEETDENAPEVSEEVKERHQKISDDVDSVLDEIDEVLEADAESFVKGFVQKGGE